jgi:hypothetical protein
MEDNLEDEEDEQEVTRCVCTFLEYPGPPSVTTRTKDSAVDSDVPNEESGLFIQCDTCKGPFLDNQPVFSPFLAGRAAVAADDERDRFGSP